MSSSIKKYKMEPCGWASIGLLMKAYHYLHRMPSGVMQCFILLDENGLSPLGGAVFSNGRIQYEGKYLDFSRLWVDDKCPRNTESRFVSYCLKYLAKHYPTYKGVVTWADPQAGHDGTLYKACNFTYDGNSRPVKRYYNPMSKKIVYQRSYTGQKGFEQIKDDKPKARFVYYFDSKVRESSRLSNPACITSRCIISTS